MEQSIATAFGLRAYKDVIVSIVNPCNVALDSVELTFKDQYMGRSEMWRLKQNLVTTSSVEYTSIFYETFLDRHLRIHQQEDRVLRRSGSVPSVRDVVARRPRCVWRYHRRHQDRVSVVHIDGLSIFANVVGDVGF